MAQTNYEWQQLALTKTPLAAQIAEQCDLPPLLAQLLVHRGCTSLAEAQQFLKPQVQMIKDPTALHDMAPAVDRLMQAIEAGELITVYGDYDADGITSTALMVETLETVGANVNYYVPDRFKDGYGPNQAAYQRLIEAGTQLILTVDNGVSGQEAIAYANAQGVDVVITDHHSLPAELPEAVAIVHPQYPGDEYPGGDLSGVGVAFKVAWALLEEFPTELLDLVAIGEIADVVSVAGENRALIALGLQQLRLGARIGLHELLALTNADEAHLTDQEVGFQLAPRLNALGRLQDANQGVELLTTLDEDRAKQLAQVVDDCNQKRQALVQEVTAAALALAQSPAQKDQPVLLLVGHGWHQGVLGIVASHVLQATGKPTIIASVNEGENVAKASGRSRAGFNLFDALDAHRDLLVAFGGHPLACGLSFEVAQTDALQAVLQAAATAQQFDGQTKPTLTLAGELTAQELTVDFYRQLQRLAPFGPENEQPVFLVRPQQIGAVQTMGKQQQHLKFTLPTPAGEVAVVAFNHADWAPVLQAAMPELAVKLDLNRWRGQTSLQLLLEDQRTTGPVVEDARVSRLIAPMFAETAVYVTFNQQLRENLTGNAAGQVVSAHQAQTMDLTDQTVVIVDCPPDLATVTAIIQNAKTAAKLRWLCYSREPLHQAGMPNRQQFVALYQTIRQQAVNLNQMGSQLANYLRVNNEQLIFMIHVFLELRFVTIKGGVLAPVDEITRADLTQTMSYRQRAARLEVEQVLLTSSTAQLQHWVQQALAN